MGLAAASPFFYEKFFAWHTIGAFFNGKVVAKNTFGERKHLRFEN